MGNQEEASLVLLVVVVGAFIVPLISVRFGIPAVVGEILYGLLLGPTVIGALPSSLSSILDPANPQPLLQFFADFGFLLLMFMAGLEIDFDLLAQQGRRTLLITMAFFIFACGLGWLFAHWLGLSGFYSLILATVSVGLVLPILREYGIGRSHLGQIILLTAIIADFLTIIAVTVYDLVVHYGSGPQVFMIALLFVAAAVILWGLKVLVWWYPHYFRVFFEQEHAAEVGVRGALAMLFIFAAIAELVHIEAILGAFLAGALISLLFRDTGPLTSKLSGISFGFFIPVFFINVGRGLDLHSLLEPGQLRVLAGLVAAAYACKLLPAPLLLATGLTRRQVGAVGCLLATPFSLSIAAAEIGVRLGLLTAQDKVAIILLAVTTALISPMLFRLMLGESLTKLSGASRTTAGEEGLHP